MVAELWVVRQGLILAWSKSYAQVIVEMDFQDTLNLFLSAWNSNHPYFGEWADIKALSNKVWVCSFNHIIRQGNACANILAKIGAY